MVISVGREDRRLRAATLEPAHQRKHSRSRSGVKGGCDGIAADQSARDSALGADAVRGDEECRRQALLAASL